MKRIIFAMLAMALIYGCNKGSGVSYAITVTVPEDTEGIRVVKSEMGMPDVTELKFDAATSTYTGKGYIEEPMMALIVDGDDEVLTQVCIEEGDIRVGYDEDAMAYKVSGTPANDALSTYRPQLLAMVEEWEQIPDPSEEDKNNFVKAYYDKVLEIVDLNIDNIYGVSLFASSGISALEPDEIEEYLGRFPEHLQNNTRLEPVRRYVEAARNTSIGSSYTDITASDPEGKVIPLSSVVGEGRWVLIDFWATWCGPCRGELPYLKAAYEKYADKGFEIYGVSLDNDAAAWKAFLPANEMTWINVIDVRENKSSPAAEAYGIESIPSNFLISPEGKIVARNLRGTAVEEKLSEIFE